MPTCLPIFEKLSVPLPTAMSTGLLDFWQRLFADSFASLHPVLAGEELAFNADTLYLARCEGELASTCRLTVCRASPALAALGEVATAEPFRGAGLAARLCQQARDDFFSTGGRAIFLATSNPIATRLYERLGWRFLPNTRILVNLAGNTSLETITAPPAALQNVMIRPADPGARIPMVPLLAAAHPWRVLDSNTGMYSTRFTIQKSCEGLYHAYQGLRQNGRGEWFLADTGPGQLLGLASALETPGDRPGLVRVDGFVHAAHSPLWPRLIQAAIVWSRARGAAEIEAHIASEDDAKQAAFRALGFAPTGDAPPLVFEGQHRPATRLRLRHDSAAL